MKNKIIILCFVGLLFTACGYWINAKYTNMSKETQAKYAVPSLEKTEDFYLPSATYKAFKTDAVQIKEIIKKSPKKFVLLVFSAYWCKPCHQNMKTVLSLENKNADLLNTIYISSSDWLELGFDLQYLKRYKVKHKTSLILDIYKYGDKYMPWERLSRCMAELENTKPQDIGVPYYLLFNNKGELLISGSGYPFPTEKFQQFLDKK